MNLIIDVGNTLSKCFVLEGGRIVETLKGPRVDMDMLLGVLARHPQVNKGIALATGKVPREVLDELATRLGRFIQFGHNTPVPIGNRYLTPGTLGLDRLAAAVGACGLYPGKRLMVLDFGTAITIDFIEDNSFMGGNISPGLLTRFRALHHFTERLPLCGVDERVPLVGVSTTTAIQAGVQQGVLAEVEAYMVRYADHRVIFTGGDAPFFASNIKRPFVVEGNLVALGLNAVLEHNAARCHP